MLILIVFILTSCSAAKNLFPHCPDSCDDGDICTEDFCSRKTKFECQHRLLVPCDGNGICEPNEYPSVDCPDCDDGNYCTDDDYNLTSEKCSNKDITRQYIIEFSEDDPRDYLKPFITAFNEGNQRKMKCYFTQQLPDEEILSFINLEKDFSDYNVSIKTWSVNNMVTLDVEDPNKGHHKVVFFMRKIHGRWIIQKINDIDDILQ
jgi:hypothetical protein